MIAGLKKVAKRRINPKRDLIQLRAEPWWIQAVQEAAEGIGLNLSAFLRMAANNEYKRMFGDVPKKPNEGKGK
jgi:hypothetical protein